MNPIDPGREILFLPDFFLGSPVADTTGRCNIHVWMGECHMHTDMDADTLIQQGAAHPEAGPEYGCITHALALPPEGIPTHVLSTDGMISHSRSSPANQFIVATEVGLLHRLRKENGEKEFIAANEAALCPFMNRISLEKIRDSLRYRQFVVDVPEPLRTQALVPLERMISMG